MVFNSSIHFVHLAKLLLRLLLGLFQTIMIMLWNPPAANVSVSQHGMAFHVIFELLFEFETSSEPTSLVRALYFVKICILINPCEFQKQKLAATSLLNSLYPWKESVKIRKNQITGKKIIYLA